MKLKTLFVLLGLLWFSPAYLLYAGAYPITLGKKTASSTGTLATPTYDIATVTLTNIFRTTPVEIVGTPTVSVTGVPTVSVTGTPSVTLVGPSDVTEVPLSSGETLMFLSTDTSASVTPVLANRRTILIQNLSSTVSVWVNVGSPVATLSTGLELTPGAVYTGPWDSTVPVSFISSASTPITVVQGS